MEKVAAEGFVPRGQETLSGMLKLWICHSWPKCSVSSSPAKVRSPSRNETTLENGTSSHRLAVGRQRFPRLIVL